MLIPRITDAISAELTQRGLDGRRCYTHVAPIPPDGGRVRVEVSDGDVLSSIRERIGANGNTGLIDWIILPEAGTSLPQRYVSASSVADVRRQPDHASELLTQIIYGDVALPLKIEGDWVLVRLDDGYVGWIRSWHLHDVTIDENDSYAKGVGFRVAVNHAEVFTAPDAESLRVTDLVIGTRLVATACGQRGWRAVTLPDGKSGYLRAQSLEKQPRAGRVVRERLASTGLRFLGTPYIWGGTTPKGFDCSGLIQRIFALHGVRLPRDSDIQSGFGELVSTRNPAALRTGDLLFFGRTAERITHVAMMLTDGLFLHAYGQVRVGSLDPRHALYEKKLHRDWQLTRNPIA